MQQLGLEGAQGAEEPGQAHAEAGLAEAEHTCAAQRVGRRGVLLLQRHHE